MYKIALTSRYKLPYYYIKEALFSFLQSSFEIILVLPQTNYNNIVQSCDALLICGGDDIDSFYLKEKKNPASTIENPQIEQLDFALIHLFYKNKKPIFGICRGIQVINVYFKGTINQNIESFISHTQSHHFTYFYPSFLSLYFPKKLLINSFHHQSILQVAPLFSISSISQDHIIESIENKNVIAVQWHPEHMNKQHQKQFLLMMNDFISFNSKKTS